MTKRATATARRGGQDMKQATNRDKVAEFHRIMGQAVGAEPTKELLELRLRLIREEVKEVIGAANEAINALDAGQPVPRSALINMTAELADLEYVTHGMAVALGLPTDIAFQRVHAANLTKIWADGRPRFRDDGKVLKPDTFKPATFDDLFPEAV